MYVHILPVLVFLICLYKQGFNVAYYRYNKDHGYGMETLAPSFIFVGFTLAYYVLYAYFKLF